MALIDTSMEFPKNCHDCQHTSCTYYFAPWLKTDEYKTKRYEKCPLKSTEAMIKEIEELESPFGEYGEWYDGKDDCLEIIQKYCDKENKL